MANQRVFNRRSCLGLIAISLAAPVLYATIQGCLALYFPAIIGKFGIQTGTDVVGVMTAAYIAGASLAGAILSFLLVLLAKQKSVLLGLALGIIATALLAPLKFSQVSSVAPPLWWSALEYVAFIAVCAAVPLLRRDSLTNRRA